MDLLFEIETNRNLLIVSILLILAGITFNAYLVSLLGFFLLFPALLSSPKPRKSKTPTSGPQEQPRRIAPRPTAVMEPPSVLQVPAAVTPTTSPPPTASPTNFSPPLFPKSIFPSFSQPMQTATQGTKMEAPASKDELLEVGALLALLRLALG